MADVSLALEWTGTGAQFRGGSTGGPEIVLDSEGAAGPTPPVALALALAGCMAVDVLDIVHKMRVPLSGLRVLLEGDRRADPPRRFTALRQTFIASGVSAGDESKVRRAIDLSQEKYCSVLHSLREDIAFSFDLDLE